MSKRRSTEWDDNRLDSLAIKYREMKAQIWSGLAKELGETWEDVEKAVSRMIYTISNTYTDMALGHKTRLESS